MKRIFAILMMLCLLVSLMAGCSQESTGAETVVEPTNDTTVNTDTTPAEDSNAETTEPAVEDTAEDTTTEAVTTGIDTSGSSMKTVTYGKYEIDNVPYAEGNKGTGGLVLPLVEEPTEISIFTGYQNSYLSSPAEILCYQEIAERTGVTIDWQTYVQDDQWSIFLASGLYTDIIFARVSSYTGGIDKGIEDEIYMPANEYLQYAPNFSRLLAADKSVDVQSKTDSGNYFFSTVQMGNEPAWIGPLVRTDWLADLNLEKPVTYDDWYEMLTLFKTEKGHEGMMIANIGVDNTGFGLVAGYDTCGTFYAKDGTTAAYGILDEGMRDYIAMLQKWYSEGLIQKDFVSQNGFGDGNRLYASNSACAFEGLPVAFIPTLQAVNPEEDTIEACVLPSVTEEQQGNLHFRRYNQIVGQTCAFISTAAVERGVDVLCAQWLDYRYSEEGSFILNYGKEGESYVMGEDGYPHFTDYVANNPDYSSTEMRDMCTAGNTGNAYYMWCWGYDLSGDVTYDSYRTWSDCSKGDWVMPDVTLNTAEAEGYAGTFGDIDTYVGEMLLRFITGDASMDEWDGFVAEVRNMGIDECIGYYQAALDRYNNR